QRAEHGRAEQDAGGDLADHRRLTEMPDRRSDELADADHGRDREEQPGERGRVDDGGPDYPAAADAGVDQRDDGHGRQYDKGEVGRDDAGPAVPGRGWSADRVLLEVDPAWTIGMWRAAGSASAGGPQGPTRSGRYRWPDPCCAGLTARNPSGEGTIMVRNV